MQGTGTGGEEDPSSLGESSGVGASDGTVWGLKEQLLQCEGGLCLNMVHGLGSSADARCPSTETC